MRLMEKFLVQLMDVSRSRLALGTFSERTSGSPQLRIFKNLGDTVEFFRKFQGARAIGEVKRALRLFFSRRCSAQTLALCSLIVGSFLRI